jgi:hypothetical protein
LILEFTAESAESAEDAVDAPSSAPYKKVTDFRIVIPAIF